ncbi:MAG: hypothetical protein OXL41_12895, partial [Nitrospinae bacterium]|nr:hypothetical protein [Nitrospinota bacterium]
TQREVDEEVEKILDGAYARATEILTERRDDLETLTARLLEQETIGGDELRAALGVVEAREGDSVS